MCSVLALYNSLHGVQEPAQGNSSKGIFPNFSLTCISSCGLNNADPLNVTMTFTAVSLQGAFLSVGAFEYIFKGTRLPEFHMTSDINNDDNREK